MRPPPHFLTPCLRDMEAEERRVSGDPEAVAELHLKKWRLIHQHLLERPFSVSQTPPRSEQWRRVRDHLKQTLDERELLDWVIQQIDVAANLAVGVHEMRPRKNGPCYDVMMEWVANRRAKAEAVIRWVRGVA